MKVFSVFGITQSGKTTTIEKIIRELRKRNYSVGSMKEIHYDKFAIDKEGTNTDRHKKAGSQLVTAKGYNETDILYQESLPLDKILKHYDFDYVVLEGVQDANIPKIIAAHTIEEIDERLSDSVFAISGRIAGEISEYKGIPALSAMDNTEALVDLIEEKVFERLPDFPIACCGYCGMSCRELCAAILRGENKREDCILSNSSVHLKVDGKEIIMVPFVQRILENTIRGVVSELEGYRKNGVIEIKIGF